MHQQYALPPSQLLGTVLPNVNGRGDTFVGVAALSFAIAGLLLVWPRIPQVRMAGVLSDWVAS